MKKVSLMKIKKWCKKKFCLDENNEKDENENDEKIKKYQSGKDHYSGKFRGAAHSICNLRYKVPKNIPIVIHNGSIYDYDFIINQLTEEFNGEFDCIGENMENMLLFWYQLKKMW